MKCNNKNCNNELKGRQKLFCSRSCTNIGKILSQETKDKISKSKIGSFVSEEVREKIRSKLINKKRPEEVGLKISKSMKGRSTRPKDYIYTEEHKRKISESMKVAKSGIKASKETKQKMRISAIRNIEKYRGKLSAFVGKNETKLLNEIEQKENCKIKRQHILRKLGYIVDGYCKETNTVYEVYEPFHYQTEEKIQKDLKRKEEIENFLNCKFIIIEDKNE